MRQFRIRQKSFYVGSRKDGTWRTFLVEVWGERDGKTAFPAVVRIELGQADLPARMLLPAPGGPLSLDSAEDVLRVTAHAMSLVRAYERRRIKSVSEPAGSVD